MGGASSKAGRTAAAAVSRKYPTTGRSRVSPSQPGPQDGTRVQQRASEVKDPVIDLDGRDPAFAASLRTIGPIDHPTPTHSNTSTFTPATADVRRNPALALLAARSRLAERAETEALSIGKKGFPGRAFVDAVTLRQVLRLRDEGGVADMEIERRLGLKRGVVGRLGRKGVVGGV
ncbi:MAG: hypothetical protein M1839_007393 [Geoglossum umbratile]|nr:MAG: hypothetical protein M1839_007393 [Geoglossum umbratile]